MNDSREPDEWLDADLTDRLLSGQDVPGSDRRIAELARLLAAVADGLPPGRPEDEGAALAAFRRERDHPSCQGVRTRVHMARPAKVLAGGLAAVLAVAGAAIAAQQGVLPRPFAPGHRTSAPPASGPAVRPSPSASTASARERTPTGGVPGPGTTSTPPPSARSSSHPAGHGGAPAVPGLKGLCVAYVEASRHGKPLDAPSLARLATAAGGKDKVDGYCALRVTLTSAGPTAPVVDHPPISVAPSVSGTPSVPVAPSATGTPSVPVVPSASVTPSAPDTPSVAPTTPSATVPVTPPPLLPPPGPAARAG